ncbi:MAG TPA: FUSC family protein [Candidatus Methylacidiphilales bacterium]|jgi:uncharacterized membrane protein YccC|nr:FUSC family protein [Candidatus Methylacidiphilales bacterium]
MNGFALRNRFWLPPLPAWVNGASVAFAVRTWLASMLALYLGFCLQLQDPYWAPLSVWIVALPGPGMLFSKGFYLVLGTVAGVVLGITLMALFNQMPESFIAALAVLTGGCTVVANLVTNFRAYGVVLTAFTAAIIAAFAVDDPLSTFDIAMARGACILTGLACAILVSSIFAPHNAEAQTRKGLLLALQDAARRAAVTWDEPNEQRLAIGRKLIFELIALDTQIEYAAAESAVLRLLDNEARSLVAHLFSVVSARRSLDAHLTQHGWPRHDALQIFHGVAVDFLHEMPPRLERGEVAGLLDELDVIRDQLLRLHPEAEAMPEEEIVSARLVIDRMDDILEHFKGALEDWQNLIEGRRVKRPQVTLNFHKDIRAAWINGLRALAAVCAAGAFWIASAWPTGSLAVVFTVVCLSLFSNLPHPDRAGWLFLKGGALGAVVAVIYKFFVVNGPDDFSYLLLTSSVILIPLGIFFLRPGYLPACGSFSFVFLSVGQFDNAMTYDLSDTLNRSLAILGGQLFGTLGYILIFPVDPVAARRYVTYRIRSGLRMQAVKKLTAESTSDWETRMYDRVMRLGDPENPSATPTSKWVDAGLEALTLGDQLLQLRGRLEKEKLPRPVREAAQRTVDAFARFLRRPDDALVIVQEQIAALTGHDPGPGHAADRLCWARMLGSLWEIEYYLASSPVLSTRVTTLW